MFRPWSYSSPTPDYYSCQRRLEEASQYGFQQLVMVAIREKSNIPPFSIPTMVSVSTTVDRFSLDYLNKYNIHNFGDPYYVTGNGSCLFNAVSVALCGNESLATELRVRTCIEMSIRKDFYTSIPKAKDLMFVSPNYISSLNDCAKADGWSSAWTIFAMSEVIGIPIESVYPPYNGNTDIAFKILNTMAIPRNCRHHNKVTIMWTRTVPKIKDMWTPNHFVPLLRLNSTQLQSSLSKSNFPPLPIPHNPHFFSTSSNTTPVSTINSPVATSPTPVSANNSPVAPSPSPQSPLPSVDSFNKLTPLSTSSPKPNLNSSHGLNVSPKRSPSIDLDTTDSEVDLPVNEFKQPIGVNATNGRFMSAIEAFDHVTKKEKVFDDCPPGNKSNVWFLVRSSQSTSGQKRTYYDDCGIWDGSKARTHIQKYLLSDNFRVIFEKQGLYCIKQRQRGKVIWTPIQPQPQPDDIITMHRYETVLKSNTDFKKHVSWFQSTTDSTLCDTVLYEYSGQYQISTTSTKVRTNPKVIQQIKNEAPSKKPKEIYLQMNRDDSVLAPKDTKQIRNANYRMKKDTQPAYNNNIADEILQVLSMINTHPFVQQVIHAKGLVPSIICYTNDQMTDLKQFINKTENPIIGVDRTFNLGTFFVTSLVYKNQRVIRKETKDHPIFAGPILLHKDATYPTYLSFFSHLSAKIKIDNIELRIPPEIEFGSDDEKALTNGISDAFPNASRRLCTKHLKDNIKHYLQNKVGVDSTERNDIMESVFGDLGLANADNTIDFETKSANLKQKFSKYPQFSDYFEKRLKERINTFVNVPRRNNTEMSEKLWTNNNAESINHVFKVAVNWKPQSLPELIKTLFDCIDIQFHHLRGCLHYSGDYLLIASEEHYRISDQLWRCKSTEEKAAMFQTVLNDKRRKRQESEVGYLFLIPNSLFK